MAIDPSAITRARLTARIAELKAAGQDASAFEAALADLPPGGSSDAPPSRVLLPDLD